MCDFVSWFENPKTKEVFFLTDNDVFNTKEGNALQKHCGSGNDLVGHGAIREFYKISDRARSKLCQHECTDFSDPKIFPKEIRRALLGEKMVRLCEIGNGNFYKNHLRTDIEMTEQAIEAIMKLFPLEDKTIRRNFKAALKKEKRINDYSGRSWTRIILWGGTKQGKNYWNDKQSLFKEDLYIDEILDQVKAIMPTKKRALYPTLNAAWKKEYRKLKIGKKKSSS